MKECKYLFKIFLVLLSLPCLTLNVYSQIGPDLLDKSWKVDFDRYEHISNMKEAEWEAYKQLSVMEKKEILDKMQKEADMAIFRFNSDLSFIVQMNGELIEKGTWMLGSDGKTILARNDQGYEDKITLLEVGPKKIVFNSEQYGQKVTLIPSQN